MVELLNTAQLAASSDSIKLDNLRKVQEIIVNLSPDLLDSFLDEVLAFQTDRSQEVRYCRVKTPVALSLVGTC